jgi:bifunctional DNA-binding transcriptional regulator/antitoxin component of YhaV-PrlF toxin-antitoxin module
MAKDLVRKVIKNGRGTFYVNIPKKIIAELKWKERRPVRVKRSGEKVIIEEFPSQRKLF